MTYSTNVKEVEKLISIIIYKNYSRIPKNYYLTIDDWKSILLIEYYNFLQIFPTEKNNMKLLYAHLNQFLLNRIQDLYTQKRNINNVYSFDLNVNSYMYQEHSNDIILFLDFKRKLEKVFTLYKLPLKEINLILHGGESLLNILRKYKKEKFKKEIIDFLKKDE